MDARLIRYYKKQMYGGRSLAARVIDFIMLRFMLLFIIFLAVLNFSRSLTVALLMAAFITLALSFTLALFRRKRIRRFIEKDTIRIKQKCLLEELTLMAPDDYTSYMSSIFDGLSDIRMTEHGFAAIRNETIYYVFHNHPSTTVGVDNILDIYRQYRDRDIVVVTLSDINEAARTFCSGRSITLVSGKKVLQLAGEKDMLPDEEAAQEKAKAEMSQTIVTLDKLKNIAFSRQKVKAYILCGLVVMCWPFVMGFKIYYPIIAVICFIMAAITFRKNRTHEESHGIGIT